MKNKIRGVYLRGDGYYSYQRRLWNQELGDYEKKPKAVILGSKRLSRKEVEAALAKVKKEDNKNEANARAFPVRSLADDIEKYLEKRNLEVDRGDRSYNTYRTEKGALYSFRDFMEEYYKGISTTEIDETHFIHWKEKRRESVSVTTIAINMRHVKAAFSYLAQTMKIIPKNPFLGTSIPRGKRRTVDGLQDFYQKLYHSVEIELEERRNSSAKPRKRKPDNKKNDSEKFFDNKWFLHYVWIMLNTGMRTGEVGLLKWRKGKEDGANGLSVSYAHISKGGDELVIYSKLKPRTNAITKPIKESLEAIKKIQRKFDTSPTYVFENPKLSKPYTVTTVGKLFSKMLDYFDIDYDDDNPFKPYDIRHGYITLLVHEGVSTYQIADLVGNSQGVIEKNYAESLSKNLLPLQNIAYAKMHPKPKTKPKTKPKK